MDSSEVLRQPFNIETHKKTFINYLEVVILEDGTIEYAVPSHQEKLIKLACQKLGVSREELEKMCPVEYYVDYEYWLCSVSGTVSLRTMMMEGIPNEIQMERLLELKREGLYEGKISVRQRDY